MLGKKTLVVALLATAGLTNAANASGDTFLGAIVGGTLGAAIGHGVGGRDATVIGGVIGAAAGASIAESNRYAYGRSGGYVEPAGYYSAPPVRIVDRGGYGGGYGGSYYGSYYAPPVVYAPPAVVYTNRYGYRDGYSGRDGRRDARYVEDYRRGDRDGWSRRDDHRDRDYGWRGQR